MTIEADYVPSFGDYSSKSHAREVKSQSRWGLYSTSLCGFALDCLYVTGQIQQPCIHEVNIRNSSMRRNYRPARQFTPFRIPSEQLYHSLRLVPFDIVTLTRSVRPPHDHHVDPAEFLLSRLR